MNPRVKSVKPEANYRLRIVFSDGQSGVFDCSPYLDFGVFRELRDVDYFQKVSVSNGTVVWPNEQDICPDTLFEEAVKNIPESKSAARAI